MIKFSKCPAINAIYVWWRLRKLYFNDQTFHSLTWKKNMLTYVNNYCIDNPGLVMHYLTLIIMMVIIIVVIMLDKLV